MDETSLVEALPTRSFKLSLFFVVEEISPEEACEFGRIDCLLVTNLLTVSLEFCLGIVRNLGELVLRVTLCKALDSEAATEEGGCKNDVAFEGT